MDDTLHRILNDLVAMPPVEGAMVLSSRGRILAACVPGGTDARSLARECCEVLDAGTEALAPEGSDLVRVDLRGTGGSTVVLRAGKDAILAVITSTRTPESLSLELSRAAEAVRRALR